MTFLPVRSLPVFAHAGPMSLPYPLRGHSHTSETLSGASQTPGGSAPPVPERSRRGCVEPAPWRRERGWSACHTPDTGTIGGTTPTVIRCWKTSFITGSPTERKDDVPRRRTSRAPGSAFMKALIPRPARSRKRRSARPSVKVPAVKMLTSAPKARAGKAAVKRTRTASNPARQKPSEDRRPGRGTWRQFRYSGLAGSRSYRVYVPFGLRRTTRAPLLLALHGCAQTSVDFATSTRLNQLADQHGFVVVYPEQTPCTTHNGAGTGSARRTNFGRRANRQFSPGSCAGWQPKPRRGVSTRPDVRHRPFCRWSDGRGAGGNVPGDVCRCRRALRAAIPVRVQSDQRHPCLLYTSDAA